MLRARTLAALFTLLTLTASAQTADPAQTAVARVFHPAPPLPSYDVATIKPSVPVTGSNGMIVLSGTTVRRYIRTAFAPASVSLAPSQVIGGPEWIDKDTYTITGKPSADLEVALRKMTNDERGVQQHMMQQSLLADRFHLKVHSEVRVMSVYALVPAKGGLKIKEVAAPPPPDPLNPPPPLGPNAPVRPGTSMMMMSAGSRTLKAGATTMTSFVSRISTEMGDRPMIDQTGFTGYFDVELKWAPLDSATTSDSSDLPSLATALEETLGIKLVATKGPVEIVVIDSIDHPSEN